MSQRSARAGPRVCVSAGASEASATHPVAGVGESFLPGEGTDQVRSVMYLFICLFMYLLKEESVHRTVKTIITTTHVVCLNVSAYSFFSCFRLTCPAEICGGVQTHSAPRR